MTLRTTKISLGVLGLVFAAAALLSLVSSKPVYSQATCSTRRVSVNGSTTNGTTNVIANATTFTVSLSGYTPGPGAYFYASGGSTMNAMTHVSGSINGGSYRTLETGRFQIRAGGLWTETATGALCDADGDHYFSFTYYQYVISQGLTFSVVANDSVNKPNAHTFTVDVIQVPDWTGINRGWNFGAVTLTARTTSNISVTPQSVTPGLGRAVTIPTSGTSGTYPKVEQIWFQLYSGATLIAESLLDGISPQGPVLTINDPSGVIIGCPAAQPLLVSSGNLNGGSSITVRSPAGYTYAGTDAFSIASGAASAGNSTTTLSSPENSYTSATISSSSVSGGTVVIRPKAGVWSYASLSGSAANCNLADQSVTLSGFNVQNYGVQTTVQGSGYSYITVTINNDGNYTAPITTTFTTSNGPAGSALCDSANSNCNPGSTGQTFTFSGSYKDVKLRVPNTSTGTYNYSVTATGAGGVTFSRNYTVTVTSLQMTTSFTVNGVVIASNNTSADSPVGLNVGSVASGSTVAFSWTAENFADTYCLLSYDNNDQSYSGNLTPGNNGYNVSGSTVMSLGASSVSRQYKFFLRCSSPSTGKSHSRYAYVNVTAGPATLNLTTSVNGTAGAMAAKSGDTIVLAWTGTNINANSCVVSGPSGALLPSPSSGLPASSSANITVPTPTGATSVQYTLTCAATAGGNATASSQVINLSEIVGFITTSYNIPNPLRQGVAFNNSTTSPAIRLDWQVQNITSCTVERWYNDTTSGGTMSGTFSGASNKYDSPYTPLHNGTLVYRMTCSSPAGTLTKDTTPARNVLPPLLTCPNGTVTVFKDYSGTVVPAPAVVRGVANRFKVKITPATSAFKRNASSSYQIVTTNGVTATWAWTGAADTTEAYINLNGSGGVGAFTVRAINFDDAAVGGATGCNPSGPGTIADSTPIQAEDVAPQVLQSGVYAQSGTGYWVTNQGSNLTFSLLMRRATGSNWDFGAVPLVTPGPMLEKQDGTSVSGTFSTTSPTPDAALTYSFVCDATPTCPVKQYLTPTTISFSYQIRDGATVLATRTFNSQNFIVYPPVGVTLLINGVSDNVVYAPSGGVSTASWTLSNSSDDYLKNCRLNDGATNYTPSTTSASLGVISANTSTKINCGDVSPVTDANRRATDTTTINAVLPTNPNSYSSANASTAGLAVTPTVACTDTLVTFDLPGVPAGTSYLVAKGKPTSGSTDYTATRDSSGKYFILFPGLASGSAIDLWVEVGGVRSTTVNTTANVSTNCNFNLNNSDIEISKIGDTAATYTSYVACDGSQSTLADDSPEQKADGDITVQINLCNLTGQSATIKNTAADALDIKIHFINLFKSDGTDWNVNDVKIYDDTYNGNNEATAEITSKANCPWQTNTKTATTSTVCVRVLPTPQKIFPQYGVANRIWLARITGRLARATTVGSVWKTSASLEYPTILNADTGCTGNLAQSVTKRGCTNIDTKYQIYISGPLIERKEKK